MDCENDSRDDAMAVITLSSGRRLAADPFSAEGLLPYPLPGPAEVALHLLHAVLGPVNDALAIGP